jgi:cytochrome c oxidase subunit 2
VIEFTPDKAGEFTLHCSVFCGFGHHGMKARLVVVEPSK